MSHRTLVFTVVLPSSTRVLVITTGLVVKQATGQTSGQAQVHTTPSIGVPIASPMTTLISTPTSITSSMSSKMKNISAGTGTLATDMHTDVLDACISASGLRSGSISLEEQISELKPIQATFSQPPTYASAYSQFNNNSTNKNNNNSTTNNNQTISNTC